MLNRLVSEGKSFSGYEKNPLFINLRGSGFAEIGGLVGAGFDDDARAVATFDWDLDGDLDLWVTNRTGPRLRLLRNNLPRESGHVAFRLIGNGTTTNRDAVGARLVLRTNGSPERAQMRTIRAGDGFLSQSSAWVHFGLAADEGPLQLAVEWPGGGSESFPDLEANRRYRIVQGEGAVPEPPVEGPAPVPGGDGDGDELAGAEGDANGGGGAIWVANRVPMPEMRFTDPAGAGRSTDEWRGRPVLVSLWATWCAPCLAELAEFAAHAEALRARGAEVLALNVDHAAIGGGDPSASADPDQVLDDIGYRLSRGQAEDGAVEMAAVIIEHLTARRGGLALPVSFLVDRDGSVAAAYLGGLSWSRLEADLALLDAPAAAQLDRLSPRAGRWAVDPRLDDPRSALADYATLFATNGLPAESQRIYGTLAPAAGDRSAGEHYNLAKAAAQQGKNDEAVRHYREAIRLDPEYGQAITGLGAILLTTGAVDEAEALFTRALEIDPNHAAALINLAMIDQSRGRIDAALERLRSVLARNPDFHEAHLNAGSILASQRRFSEAIPHLEKAVALKPEQAAAHFNLASAYAASERWDEAEAAYLRVIELNGRIPHAHAGLGQLMARKGDHAAAVECYRTAIALGGGTASTHARLGRSLLALGEREAALEASRKAVEIDPRHPEAIRVLEEAGRASGG